MAIQYSFSEPSENSALCGRNAPIKRPVVLVIDDDPASVTFYRMILNMAGCRVLSAMDGHVALSLIENEINFPDLILVDCLMPEMNGESFLRKVKETMPSIFTESKLVGLTSYSSEALPFKEIKKLAHDCREKPFNMIELLNLVSDYIQVDTGFLKELGKSG